ncbi:MAG: hypothetical protein R3A47_07815 [Polyangiales bacterium]
MLLLGLVGCQPQIGDSCSNPGDCSANGVRVCDLQQPGGYCTIQSCDPDTCPSSSICVEWRYQPSRTSETWCMAECGSDSDCRSAYTCVRAEQIGENGLVGEGEAVSDAERVARVIDVDIDLSRAKFCVANSSSTN